MHMLLQVISTMYFCVVFRSRTGAQFECVLITFLNVLFHTVPLVDKFRESSEVIFECSLFAHFVHFVNVRFHLSSAEDTLATIEEIAGGAMAELIEDDDKNAVSATYPTLTR